jgi:SAM-dependent methyltransferase
VRAWPSCWCGSSELVPFSPGYLRCERCVTLVRAQIADSDIARVVDDKAEFYGREYWFSHQERDLGCPNILVRARTDLPERCLYWLRTVLRYKQPPGRVLELGSGPGGFLAMLRWAGFDATGLEISPWVVQFIRETFQVPVLCGPVEDQQIEPASLDVIALMDVLEHLPDPFSTMRHCLGLLKADGILLIQTPCYPEGRTHEEMVAQRDRFLEMLKPADHLHLFSRRSIRDLFHWLGVKHVAFETALFAEYDMFVVVSRVSPVSHGPVEIETALSARPAGRMIQALLDLDVDRSDLRRRYAESEADRAARLQALEAQGRRLGEVEGERNGLRAEASALRRELEVIEADNTARLEVIEAQGRRLGEVEGERNDLRAEMSAVRHHLEIVEADSAARLEVIETQGRHIGAIEADRAARLEVIHDQGRRLHDLEAELQSLQNLIRAIQSTRTYKLLRWLGRWRWMEHAIRRPQADSSVPRQ